MQGPLSWMIKNPIAANLLMLLLILGIKVCYYSIIPWDMVIVV